MDKNDLILEIYEAERDGKITVCERNLLLSIFEMKNSSEYKKRAFKRRFKFTPSKTDHNKGTITVDGETIRVDIGNNDILLTKEGKRRVQLKRKSGVMTIGGEIILDSGTIFRLKHPDRIDAAVYHEIGHHKLHAVDINNDDEVTNSDNTLSPYIINQIMDELRKNALSQMRKPLSESDIRRVEKNIDDFTNYFISKLEKSNIDNNLAELRKEALRLYKKFEKGGHTNWKEFEADMYAAQKTSKSAVSKSIREVYKHEKHKNHQTTNTKLNTIDAQQRTKTLNNPETSKYKDIYK